MRRTVAKIFAKWIYAGLVYLSNRFADDAYWKECQRVVLAARGFGIGAYIDDSGEATAIDWLDQKLPDDPFVLDVGANVGLYSDMVLRHWPEASIYCIEPQQPAFELLRNRFQSDDRVTLSSILLGDKCETVEIYADKPASGLGSIYNRRLEHFDIQFSEIGKAEMKTLDKFCMKENITHIDLLKMDCEGAELAILRGASRALAEGKVTAIQFETGGANIDARAYFQDIFYLLKDDFYVYRLTPHGLVEVANYDEYDEVFVTTNYYAIQKQVEIE